MHDSLSDQDIAHTLELLDDNGFLLVDGLYRVLGNHGTTSEHLEGLIEGMSNALFQYANKAQRNPQKAQKNARDILHALDALCTLANIQLDE